jgi:hypothetical protein
LFDDKTRATSVAFVVPIPTHLLRIRRQKRGILIGILYFNPYKSKFSI